MSSEWGNGASAPFRSQAVAVGAQAASGRFTILASLPGDDQSDRVREEGEHRERSGPGSSHEALARAALVARVVQGIVMAPPRASIAVPTSSRMSASWSGRSRVRPPVVGSRASHWSRV